MDELISQNIQPIEDEAQNANTVPSSHWGLITGRTIPIPEDRIVEVTEEEMESMLRHGCTRVD